MNIELIQPAIKTGKYRVTEHADEEAENDNLRLDEVVDSVLNGEIIETYPKDRPYPSCLIFGKNQDGEPIHSVWGYNEDTQAAILITVYRPDPNRWIEWKRRKR